MPVKEATKTAIASFYAAHRGNDVFWRIRGPAEAIGAQVSLVHGDDAEDAYLGPNTHTLFPWRFRGTMADGTKKVIRTRKAFDKLAKERAGFIELKAEFIGHQGAAVWIRPDIPRAAIGLAMQSQGIRTIAETDDNYFADTNMNLFLRANLKDDEEIKRFREETARAMFSMDANVFSTKILRDRYFREYKKRFGKKKPPQDFVCRNHIAASQWPERIERDGPVRVGFMGSASHVWDVNLAYPAVKAARDLGCETHFYGYNPGNPDAGIPDVIEVDGEIVEMRSEKSKKNSALWNLAISKHTGWVESTEYHRAALALDIGLCPLIADDFCLSKSDVKMIEYTISGVAGVCMNNPVYNGDWKHEVNCLMANSPREMAEQTVRLIQDPKLRFELVTAAQEYVMNERGIKQMQDEWGDAISG